jgi:hypothetical protein
MRVITFLHVGFPLAQITFSSVPVVDGLGAGNVVRSFVHLTSILKRVIRILKPKNHTMPRVVNRRKGSNRKTIAQVGIIAIVRSGGTKKETQLASEYPGLE